MRISNFLKPFNLSYGVRVRWDKVTIIGVGLLGGSIGRAVRRRGLAREVYGFVRRKAALTAALKVGAVDRGGQDIQAAVEGADLVILCTPIARMASLVRQMRPALKPGVIVTDVGSVKAPVVRALHSPIRRAGGHFVGSHPMAGSERSGPFAAREDLFEEAVCVITKDARTDGPAAARLRRFWRTLGARVMTLTPALHDKLVSRASHLPHLLASALAIQVLDPRQDKRQSQLGATGFRDTTRVALGSPEMWRDIVLANRGNLVRDLAQFETRLAKVRKALAQGDPKRVEHFLAEAQHLRSQWKPGRSASTQE